VGHDQVKPAPSGVRACRLFFSNEHEANDRALHLSTTLRQSAYTTFTTSTTTYTMTYCFPCQRTFGSPGTLRQHLKTTAVHPYCQECDLGFQTDSGYRSVSSLVLYTV
jgi:hypothetical protein